MDGKANLFAFGTQAPGQFSNALLGLCHRHTIARNDDDVVCFFQCRGHTICINRHLFALDFHLWAGTAAETAKDDADKRPIHRFTHNIRQDGTR